MDTVGEARVEWVWGAGDGGEDEVVDGDEEEDESWASTSVDGSASEAGGAGGPERHRAVQGGWSSRWEGASPGHRWVAAVAAGMLRQQRRQ